MSTGPYCYEFPRPAVTTDLVVFATRGGEPFALMIRRKRDPFAGRWAFPGGFLDLDEEAEAGARRELEEETGLDLGAVPVHFLGAWSSPGRDPRGRTVSLVHVARLPEGDGLPEVRGLDDAEAAEWRPARPGDPAGPMAFDHDDILAAALGWLEGRSS